MPVLSDTAQVSRVVSELRARKYATSKESGHVDLLDESVWWPNATNNVLFVRKVYPHLYESVLGECKRAAQGGGTASGTSAFHQEKAQRRIITGQPGIGKSVFGWYIIFRVLTEQPHRTIVYSSYHEANTYIIPPTGPVRMLPREQLPLAGLQLIEGIGDDILVIADSFVPPVLPFPTVVISSPGRLLQRDLRDILNHYKKGWLYMPIPTEEELLELHKTAFSGVPLGGVRQRMELWGPIPRNVLVEIDDDAQNQDIKRSESVPLDVLAALARGQAIAAERNGSPEDAPHRVLHERAAGQDAEPGSSEADPASAAYYRPGNVLIASLSFLRHVIERLMKEQKWNAAFLVDASAGIGPLGALRGIKFEEVVLDLLERGVSLKARNLQDGKELTMEFPPARRIGWKKPTDLVAHRNTANSLLVPDNRNQAGLDALVWAEGTQHHEPLDTTVSESHGLHARGLADALAGLGWTPGGGWPQVSSTNRKQTQVRYFWAIPEERYFWSPPAASVTFKHVAQYALCIPRNVTLSKIEAVCKEQGVRLPSEYQSLFSDQVNVARPNHHPSAQSQSRRYFSTVTVARSRYRLPKVAAAVASSAITAAALYRRTFG